MKDTAANSIYGPVDSWRLGRSLGVDLLCVDSICSFRCVYCQLGKINRVTMTRGIFVPTEKLLRDLERSDWRSADVVTFSGSGEPTLAANLGEAIEQIKSITGKPAVVLTDATLLYQPEVRREIASADRIFCKLDAWSEESLRRVNRPHESVTFESIVSGIKLLRREYDGLLAVQTMILRALTDSEIDTFAEILRSIAPDEIQINLPSRPVPKEYFLDSRGNAADFEGEMTRLRTISERELEDLCWRLSERVGSRIITR